jgi:hypothetical protein
LVTARSRAQAAVFAIFLPTFLKPFLPFTHRSETIKTPIDRLQTSKATNAGKEIKVQADKVILNERIRQKTTHAFAI